MLHVHYKTIYEQTRDANIKCKIWKPKQTKEKQADRQRQKKQMFATEDVHSGFTRLIQILNGNEPTRFENKGKNK